VLWRVWRGARGRYAVGMKQPLTVAGFQQLIRERYFRTDVARGTPGTFMWFIEEIGELATALQNNAPGKNPTAAERQNLHEEFADAFAWLMTLANINNVDIEAALAKYTQPAADGGVEGVKD
jgi:NTP pyrophosphatase (non-canonical NTP hydrolase)